MGAFTGKDMLIEFSIAKPDAAVGGLTWSMLGMLRGKSVKTSWDTVDATADKSPLFTKENLVSFKSVEFSGDGVSRDEAVHNQRTLKTQVINPGLATGQQPSVWLRLTDPDGSRYTGPFTFTEWSDDRPHADVATWSTSASSNGAVIFTPGA